MFCRESTTSATAPSGSTTQTDVTSEPMTSPMPRANASVASGSRIGTTLRKP